MNNKIDFTKIDYLLKGTPRQKHAYNTIVEIGILEFLKDLKPLLVGTIPIDLDIESSDIDIICKASDFDSLEVSLKEQYGIYPQFRQRRKYFQSKTSSVTSFFALDFEFEIFAQSLNSEKQRAYRHMLIEHRILCLTNSKFKKVIVDKKKSGMSTEEAFAKILGIKDNPYEKLLELEKIADQEILKMLDESFKKVL